jgi:putative ATP-dependent endonuclease of the OLD family
MRDPPPSMCNRDHHRHPLLLIVEGANDVAFLANLSRILSQDDPSIPDLEQQSRTGSIITVPFGGGSPMAWTHRFQALNCPEVHIFDRERPPETELRVRASQCVNLRPGCIAFLTRPRALENYLHGEAIRRADPTLDIPFGDDDCVATAAGASLLPQWDRGQLGGSEPPRAA